MASDIWKWLLRVTFKDVDIYLNNSSKLQPLLVLLHRLQYP